MDGCLRLGSARGLQSWIIAWITRAHRCCPWLAQSQTTAPLTGCPRSATNVSTGDGAATDEGSSCKPPPPLSPRPSSSTLDQPSATRTSCESRVALRLLASAWPLHVRLPPLDAALVPSGNCHTPAVLVLASGANGRGRRHLWLGSESKQYLWRDGLPLLA